MNTTDNDNHVCVLAKKISDFVGRTTGEEYYRALISAINKYLELSCIFVYSRNINSDNVYTVFSDALKHDCMYINISILDASLLTKKINDVKCSEIIDLDSYLDNQNIDNPLNIRSLIVFKLYDSCNDYTGLILLACTKVVSNAAVVIDTLDTQVPRVASEYERLQSNIKLRTLENNYKDLFDTAHDAIWEADTTGRITTINGSCRTIYGYSENYMIGKCYTEFMTDESAVKFAENIALIMNGEGRYNFLSDHITVDNVLIKVSYNLIPKLDANNRIIGAIGATRDISASVRAHETIKNNSELFSSILSRLPVIFFRIDEKGFLVDIRGNGLKRMGVEDMDWVGRPGYGLFIGMDSKIDSALSGNTVFFENKGTYKGTPWWFYTSMFFDSWSGYGAVGFSVDITEQKYVEEQLVELLNNNRKLAQKLVEVQEDERRSLARELHDELGQSITAVKSLATVIATTTGTQTKEIRNLAYSIIDLSGRLYDVVNNIMQRLRPDIIDSMDFNESINNCIVRSQLEAIGVNCDLNINGDINDLDEVVKITIFRIVQECLTNISKYAMASNVSIHIQRGPEYCNLTSTTGHSTVQRDYNEHLPEKRDAVKIEIIDDGVGMDVNEVVSNDVHAKRHGLQGIHERVTAMGGTLIISGNLGKGVKIQAVLLLDSSYHDISQDINKCITNLKNLRDEKQDSKKIRTH